MKQITLDYANGKTIKEVYEGYSEGVIITFTNDEFIFLKVSMEDGSGEIDDSVKLTTSNFNVVDLLRMGFTTLEELEKLEREKKEEQEKLERATYLKLKAKFEDK